MSKEKTGGRQSGTPNRRTQEIERLLGSMNCDPIEGMAEIAQLAREENDLRLAGQMYKELAQYVAPKRRSIEVRTDQSVNPIDKMTEEELEAAIRESAEFMQFVKDEIAAGRIVEVERGLLCNE